MRSLSTSLRRVSALAAVAFVPLGLAACGTKVQHPTNVDGEAQYVDAGPVTYQVQLSRQLNPFAIDDKGYLSGLTPDQLVLRPNQEWFAIFLWAKNQNPHAESTTNSFDIVDTQGNKYLPVPLNAQANPYAWTPQTLEPGATEPGPDSTAISGPTQGQEILFKLSNSVYDNRPLTLEIYAPGQSNPSTVSLDL